MKRLSLRSTDADAGERLDRFVAARGGISRGVARRAIDAGGVFVDGRRCKVASRAVQPGQQVVVNLEEGGRAAPADAVLEPSRILFSDPHLVAVDKPAGIPAQATLTRDSGTLPDLVAAVAGGPLTIVHRLDLETTGVTVLARSAEAATALAAAFRAGSIEKTYLALTMRAPSPPEGRIAAPIGADPRRPGRRVVRDGGDAAATAYRTLRTGATGCASVEARPETGRTHQIRVHLAHLGAPLLGDWRYGGPRQVAGVSLPRVMLHALRLTLTHPITGVLHSFEAPLPADFRAIEAALLG